MKEWKPDPKPEKTPKKSPKPLKKSPIKYKKRDTGQVDIFETIAEEEEWKCFVTGEPLRELKATQFMHVLSKALNKYPKFIAYRMNIVLATDEVHDKWDKWPRSEVRKDKRFDKLFKLEAELKEEYKRLHGK